MRSFGFTLIELMVSLLIFSILSSMALTQLLQSTRHSNDQEVRMEAEEIARGVLDIIVYDLRMAGSGMPLGLSEFVANTGSLGDAPLPILTSSDADTLSLRLNQLGGYALLSEDFTPSSLNEEFTVISPLILKEGATIYISNKRLGYAQGLFGEIDDISGNLISLSPGYGFSTGAIFEKGSMVTPVDTVVYDTSSAGITRDGGDGAIVLESGSTVTFSYQDESGGGFSLPLSESQIANNLTTIYVRVAVPGLRALKDGSDYVATAEQTVALRNLVLSRP